MTRQSKFRAYGFDLTSITAVDWCRVLIAAGITQCSVATADGYYWHGDDVLIVTANNPLTGGYYNGSRESEPGYASYIGIEGDNSKVLKVVRAIKKYAQDIKDEDTERRSFI